ncbi:MULTISPECIES: hypothetical protein [unclassified Sphingomonas]|uniref:hypothetical protein n=1 Tax=unclassified Sphingomonas TaxID=196159 RepID=UPI00226A318C|nr:MULTISPECIES: hypothetical protein [unclassified Sphingomonas]
MNIWENEKAQTRFSIGPHYAISISDLINNDAARAVQPTGYTSVTADVLADCALGWPSADL